MAKFFHKIAIIAMKHARFSDSKSIPKSTSPKFINMVCASCDGEKGDGIMQNFTSQIVSASENNWGGGGKAGEGQHILQAAHVSFNLVFTTRVPLPTERVQGGAQEAGHTT